MARLKIAGIFFVAYSLFIAFITYLMIGFGMFVADAYGSYPPSGLKLATEICMWICVALGTPLVPAYTLWAHAVEAKTNFLTFLLIYIVNTMFLSWLASIVAIKKHRKH